MSNKPYSTKTNVGALKKALKMVTSATGAKVASIVVDKKGMHVESATTEGYAKSRVEIEEHGDHCDAQISAALVNIILAGEDASTKIAVTPAGSDGGVRLRYSGANLLLKKTENNASDLFNQSYKSMKEEKIACVDGLELKKAAQSAAHYMAKKDIRFYLCGVHMQEIDGKLTFTGTDGLTLHRYESEIAANESARGLQAIIPTNASEAMVSVFGDERVDLLRVGDNLIGFKTNDVFWVCTLLNGKYPDINQLLRDGERDNDNEVLAAVNRKQLLAAINRVSSVSDRDGMYLRVAIDESTVKVSSIDGVQEDCVQLLKCAMPQSMLSVDFSVTTAVAIRFLEGADSDIVLLKKNKDPSAKIYMRKVTEFNRETPDSELETDAKWVALMMPARV